LRGPGWPGVGAGKAVTLCDLGILGDQPAEDLAVPYPRYLWVPKTASPTAIWAYPPIGQWNQRPPQEARNRAVSEHRALNRDRRLIYDAAGQDP
jgi:hypothetical protein